MPKIPAGKVRNVGIVGHGGTGKTVLIERLLHMAGATTRAGSIEEGNTVCDYLEEEISTKHSIALKVAMLEWKGSRIHLIDHPGYVDFVGEMASSAPVVDAMIIMVDAATGVQVGTDNAYRYAEKYHVPRAFFVNKLDREHTNFQDTAKLIREAYGKHCVPLDIAIGEGEQFEGVVNILDGHDESRAELIARLRAEITDIVAESSDELLEKYLEAGELTPEEFHHGLQVGIEEDKLMPIFAGSVTKSIGLEELLDFIAESFPSPLDRHVKALDASGAEVEVNVSENGPFLGQVFRSIVDPYVGQLSLFRVLTGTLKSDSDFVNVTSGAKERTGKLFMLRGKEQIQVDEVVPGDIAAMTKLKQTRFGDTIAVGTDLRMPKIELPESMVKLAIEPKTRTDEDKIGEALNRLAEEDPTFTHYRDPETNDHIIRGMGDQQLDIMIERMKRKFNVEATTRPPKVAYKETVRGHANVQGKHKKQSGGHGQYGDVHLKISPNHRGAGYEFIDSIVGGVVPRQYIPHVDKGCQEALARGVIAGFPVIDVKVELHYGSYHEVDSSEMAFKIAASLAIQKGVKEANPCILEPIVEIAVTVPNDCMGDINGDLNSRRGRIIGMEEAGPNRQTIRALVPEAEILRYSADLRSMTGGRGSYTVKFDHYDILPDHIAQQFIAAYEKARAEGQ